MHQSNITDNGTHAFYTSSCSDPSTVIDAENNWWGTADPAAIEALIWHHADYTNSPTVDYTPCADSPFLFDLHTGVFDTPNQNVPSDFTLSQNYPNPFNAATLIQFTLREPSYVEIEVFDLLGRSLARLASDTYTAGRHTVPFNGIDRHNQRLPSGIYFYRLTAGQHAETRKMILLK